MSANPVKGAVPQAAMTRDEAADFVHHECELLDSDRLEDWLELFTPDGHYWVPLVPGATDPLAASSILSEDRTLLRMRIQRMRHPAAHGMALPIRTSRMVGNLRILSASDEEAVLGARFSLLESDSGRLRQFAGRYTYTLRRMAGESGPAWKIREKRVDLVNCDAPFASIQILL